MMRAPERDVKRGVVGEQPPGLLAKLRLKPPRKTESARHRFASVPFLGPEAGPRPHGVRAGDTATSGAEPAALCLAV
jgi:hypothetical protein